MEKKETKKKVKRHSGMFQKGNKARTIHSQKQKQSKKILDETEKLQQQIYNASLRQILEKLEAQELSSGDLIRVNSTVAEFVNPKVKVGRAKKVNPQDNIDDLLNALTED